MTINFGLADETGTSAYNGQFTQSALLWSDQHVAVAGEHLTGYRVYCLDPAAPENFPLKLALFDVTSGLPETSTLFAGSEKIITMPAVGPAWVTVMFDDPLPLIPGNSFCRWFGRGVAGINGNVYRIAATGYSRYKDVDVTLTPQTPYGTPGGTDNFNYAYEALTEVIATGPSVNPTGTDLALTVGTPAQIVMQDMGGATATALTLRYTNGPLVVNAVQADFDYTVSDAETGTISFTPTVGNLPYGSTGYQYVITLSAGDPVLSDVTSLAPAAGFEYIVAVDPVSDETGILYQFVSGTPSSGDQGYWETDQGTYTLQINADFTFQATSETFPDTAVIPFQYWNSETGTWYSVTVNVAYSEGGGGTVTGITARNITMSGITLKAITMSNL